jgi:hypothetical protein
MAQKYSRETPKQSSTLPLPNSAIRVTSLMRAEQATQVQTLRLCPNQGWPRHRPDKLANIRQNPAFAHLSIHPVDQAWAGGRRDRKRMFFTAAQNVSFWHKAEIEDSHSNVRFREAKRTLTNHCSCGLDFMTTHPRSSRSHHTRGAALRTAPPSRCRARTAPAGCARRWRRTPHWRSPPRPAELPARRRPMAGSPGDRSARHRSFPALR